MAEHNPFENRIIGYGTKPADQFQANALNYRKHPQRQRDAVQASLRELGWIGVVVENRTTGNLIDGHERVWQALANNEDVPYIEVELSEAQEKLALAVFDPITYMAETDAEVLDALLREVNSDEAALQELLAELAEDAGLYGDAGEAVQDAEPQIDKAEELRQQWGVESGQMWQLGEHRIVCGDCTDADVVARVMGGERAIVYTDPPYGVSVVQGNKIGASNLAPTGTYAAIVGDETTETARQFYEVCVGVGFKEFIVWGGNYFTDFLPPSPCWLIWDKRGDMTSNNFADCEIAWTSFSGPARIYKQIWSGMIKEGESGSRVHPTQKPVALAGWAIKLSPADVVFDGFLGSGTTIIACEQLGRKCRAVEISPAYVAVALQRWADATGREPVQVE